MTPLIGEKIVISGMSCKCPNAMNIREMKEQIYNKVDMITGQNMRFKNTPDVPNRYGVIPNISQFDHSFFETAQREVDIMDPCNRMLYEIVVEALMDAGINLTEFQNQRVGIYSGNCMSEAEINYYCANKPELNALLGCARSVWSGRLAHFLQVSGSAFCCDAACSASIFAFQAAYQHMLEDKIDHAILISHNIILTPNVSRQFFRLGVLSTDGKCKCFDANADGYARADAIYCVVLQRSSVAKRVYCEVMNVLTNCDGYKTMGITFPSIDAQRVLINEFYKECPIDFNEIGFLEAHGTGTKVGDPIEMQMVEETICANRKDPLLVGSIKSNLGHSEGASGLASIIKLCMTLDSGLIPPNINYSVPNPAITCIASGKVKIVTEVTPLPEDKPYVALSNFGFGGANGHILLNRIQIPSSQPAIDIPRLVCLSGRLFESVEVILEDIKSRPYDPDFLALINSSFNTCIDKHTYRGFAIISKDGIQYSNTIRHTDFVKTLKCFFYTSGSIQVASEMLHFKSFDKHLNQVEKILKDENITWDRSYLCNGKTKTLDNILTTIIVQTGIVKVLEQLGIEIAEFYGTGIGEITSAYADNVINLKQAILIAYAIRRILWFQKELEPNTMYDELQKICKTIQRPSKWKVNDKLNGNLAEYLSRSMFQSKSPSYKNENHLLVGGNSSHEDYTISLCDKHTENGILHCIGRLYQFKYNTNVNALYSVKWPVKSNTPALAPLIKWNHSKTWQGVVKKVDKRDVIITDISLNDMLWQTIEGHNIDGRILFPATGYLNLAWRSFSLVPKKPVIFEDIKFLRACTVPATGELRLCLQICKKTGYFQFTEGGAMVVSGKIKFEQNIDQEWINLPKIPMPKPELMMSRKDIYKELGLRGYYYQGNFKEIQTCDINATVGAIKWTEWIPFMDNMLQIKILQEDTRSLYVPTKIDRITIDPVKHMDIVFRDGSETKCDIPVYHYKELDIIRCGFIEIRGLVASSITKRKNPNPVLESNIFVPYVANMDLRSAARVMSQLALENAYTIKVKCTEYFADLPANMQPMLPYVQQAFNDQPLVQPEFTLLTNHSLDIKTMTVANKPPSSETGNYIAIGYNLSENVELRKTLLATLKPNGFLISREPLQVYNLLHDLVILCEYTTSQERLVMMKAPEKVTLPPPININSTNFHWLEPIKAARQQKQNLLLYTENEPLNGIMGLTNCLLRESGEEKIMNVLIDDKSAPKFDISNEFYGKQLNKHMAVNVFKNGTWGSYKHLSIEESEKISTVHAFVNNTIRGDVSSLRWMQGPLCIPDNMKNIKKDETDVHVYMAALNFHDIVLVTGKVTFDSICKDRKFHECLLGMEFSGKTASGKRVMGIKESAALANYVRVDNQFIWDVPSDWSMQEAATVPCVYATLIYGLLMRAKLMQGDSILIHSATGGIGLSAINIALYYKCNIFVTVGTNEKRENILTQFPMIPGSHIGNSRNTSFYEMVLKETKGVGVDMIINSLADEKLQASVKCLKFGGRFVEIGKYDLNNDSPLNLDLATKNAEYHGVMLDNIMSAPSNIFSKISEKMNEGIKAGFVKPLPFTVFQRDELEAAFRYMTTGKHVGKVIIKVRDDEPNNVKPTILKMDAMKKVYFNPRGSYILLGGLGGFGLELADWMILRGARNLILVSRQGISNGYQQSRIILWKSYGCNIKVSTQDATARQGCEALLKEAQQLGDIMGVVNLAVVLKDAVIENQTEETFIESYNPKSQVTIYLDELTRRMAPNLEHFIVFSSVSCGRGNAGQTNYGYSNSVMERICEKRHSEGLPGKAIQWGVIGDVGIVADLKEQNIEIVIGGTLHQRIANCLEVMDIFLLHDSPIVSSIVVAEKKFGSSDNNMVDTVLELMQIKDIKIVSHNLTFPELGMDSMMAVEIKQTLEREFDIFLSPQELRNMTIAKLLELSNDKDVAVPEQNSVSHIHQLFNFIPTEDTGYTHVFPMKTSNSTKTIYLLPGVEGAANIFADMVDKLTFNATCLQFPVNDTRETVMEFAKQKFEILRNNIKPGNPFIIAAHSLGCTIALEVVTMLEQVGCTGTLYLLDGSPEFTKNIINLMSNTTTEEQHQISMILDGALSRFLPLNVRESLQEPLTEAKSFKGKCMIAIKAAPEKVAYSDEFLYLLMLNMYNRQKAELTHKFQPRTYKSRIVLCKASVASIVIPSEDYGLKALVGDNVQIQEFEGDHISILANKDLIQLIESA